MPKSPKPTAGIIVLEQQGRAPKGVHRWWSEVRYDCEAESDEITLTVSYHAFGAHYGDAAAGGSADSIGANAFPTPTRTGTPENPDDTLIIEQPDDFPPDLLADIAIGTGGVKPNLWCAIFIEGSTVNYRDSRCRSKRSRFPR